MKYRYSIFFKPESAERPYQVYNSETQKIVGTFATLEAAQAKYPHSHDYTWIKKGE